MVINGLDILLQNPEVLRHRRVGLIANQTSVSMQLEYSWMLLKRAGVELTRIFSPEHGLFAVEQDQIAVGHQPDTGCEIVSLYGDSEHSLAPARELLDGLDLVLFDIQDVGSRYYTYVNTLALFMKAAEGLDIEIMVLDRPNPLGGSLIEGPQLDPAFHSFVGVMPLPVRHGLTAGEIAHFYRNYKKLDLNLNVIPMQGWSRQMLFPETCLPWVPPSPNMPSFEAAEVYPGMCLFEGLNISEGRGTTTPFLLSGAAFVDPEALAERLASMPLEGVVFRPTWFRPTFHKYAGEAIGGLYLHVTDHARFRPFATGVAMTCALCELYPEQLAFLDGVYEFRDDIPAFDLLAGSSAIRSMILDNRDATAIIASWEKDEVEFAAIKPNFHLYDN
ncbi:MAG: exo-beta-N-acetylmuramidase NamZ family protein [Chlorobaculum sp.]